MKAVETDAGSLDGCPLDLLQVSTVYPRQLAWLSEPTIRD